MTHALAVDGVSLLMVLLTTSLLIANIRRVLRLGGDALDFMRQLGVRHVAVAGHERQQLMAERRRRAFVEISVSGRRVTRVLYQDVM